MSISLIVLNPPPSNFGGVKTTLYDILTLVSHIFSQPQSSRVIVPSQGIIDHWLNEVKIFAPHLKAFRYSSVKETLSKSSLSINFMKSLIFILQIGLDADIIVCLISFWIS